MSRLHFWFVVVPIVSAISLFATRAGAATDLFLNIAEAPGESRDARHPGWIDVVSYDELVAGSTRSFAVVMKYNKAVPKLLAATTTNQTYKLMSLDLRKAGPVPLVVLSIKFEGVRIASVTTQSTQGADWSTVRVTFICDRATWTYVSQKVDGSPDATVTWTTDFRGSAPIKLEPIPRVQ